MHSNVLGMGFCLPLKVITAVSYRRLPFCLMGKRMAFGVVFRNTLPGQDDAIKSSRNGTERGSLCWLSVLVVGDVRLQ